MKSKPKVQILVKDDRSNLGLVITLRWVKCLFFLTGFILSIKGFGVSWYWGKRRPRISRLVIGRVLDRPIKGEMAVDEHNHRIMTKSASRELERMDRE